MRPHATSRSAIITVAGQGSRCQMNGCRMLLLDRVDCFSSGGGSGGLPCCTSFVESNPCSPFGPRGLSRGTSNQSSVTTLGLKLHSRLTWLVPAPRHSSGADSSHVIAALDE